MQTKRQARADKRLFKFYEKRAKGWGEQYMKRNWWRLKGMYDMADIRQDAFSVYLRVYRYHPKLSESDLFKIYKYAMWGRVTTRSRQCFPNSHAYIADEGRLVLPIEEDRLRALTTTDIESVLIQLSDVITQLPDELVDVVKLLARDFLGCDCIIQRKRKRLKGNDSIEPLSISIARTLNLPISRELMNELEEAIHNLRGENERLCQK